MNEGRLKLIVFRAEIESILLPIKRFYGAFRCIQLQCVALLWHARPSPASGYSLLGNAAARD